MFIADRTIKTALFVIIVLLAVLVGTQLQAQTQVPPIIPNESGMLEGWDTQLVTEIKIKPADRVKNMYIIDQAQAFVVQYEDRITVYRVRDFHIDPERLKTKR